MTIREVYDSIGADYEGVVKRLPSEALVARLAAKYLNDPTYQQLTDALAAGDVETAFRAAHTLKGVCQNLGFSNMYAPVFEITEILRAGSMEGTASRMEELKKKYDLTIACINELD